MSVIAGEGIPIDPPERHRAIAAGFSAVCRAVTDWSAPTPVPEWRAADVVEHLITWVRGFLAESADLGRAPDVLAGPATAWEVHADAVQAVLDDPASERATFANPHVGELPLREAIDRFYTSDVFMHTWDLARSAGLPDPLDPRLAGEMLAGMAPMEEMLRASGQFGEAARPVAHDASPGDRLMAFLGRAV